MAEANKTYGFTIAVKELRETVPNIFRYASAYKRTKGLKSKGLWEMFLENPPKEEVPPEEDKKDRLPEEILQNEPGENTVPEVDPEAMEGESYNMCHFWSNFEIARLDWFRSKEYEEFFEMMDRSGGFWTERVRNPVASATRCFLLTLDYSGVMPLFIRWPPVLFYPLAIFIISAISDIVTLQSNIAPPMPLHDNCHESHGWKRPRRMRRSASKKMNTGRIRTLSRKTAWVVDADVTRTLSMWKANKEAVLPNG